MRKETNQVRFSDKYIHGKTVCRVCGKPMMVNGTERRRLRDGRIVLVRNMKCSSPQVHRYPLKTILEAQK